MMRMMSDSATTATEEEEAPAAPAGELTELARLEIRIGKIVEVCVFPCTVCTLVIGERSAGIERGLGEGAVLSFGSRVAQLWRAKAAGLLPTPSEGFSIFAPEGAEGSTE